MPPRLVPAPPTLLQTLLVHTGAVLTAIDAGLLLRLSVREVGCLVAGAASMPELAEDPDWSATPQGQSFLSELSRLLRLSAQRCNGDVLQAWGWLHDPNPLLGDVSPLMMVARGRMDRVIVIAQAALATGAGSGNPGMRRGP